MQCFLKLVSQLVPLGRTRLRLNAYFYWLIAQNIARQVARGVLHCANASKIRCSVAAIVAKSRTWFYFVQRLLQQKCRETWWLRGMLHYAISRATCVATTLRDLMIAGYVTSCNFSCNLCRNNIARLDDCAVCYTMQFLVQLVSQRYCETWWLRGMLHHAISRVFAFLISNFKCFLVSQQYCETSCTINCIM